MVANNPKDQLINEIKETIAEVEARIKENGSILEQSRLEVERLQQKNVNVSARLQRVEMEFDTVPRQDIKSAYEDSIEIRTRLISMRSQLEKLEDNKEHLEEFRDTLKYLMNNVQGVQIDRPVGVSAVSAMAEAGGQRLTLAGEQIIRIVEAQESERQRLANALHDGPAQSLTNFMLQAEICQRLFNRDPAKAEVELNTLRSAALTTFNKIREFIFDLRPMMLDDLGLIATMRRHAENFNEKNEAKIEFRLTGAEQRLPNHIEVIMFRAFQQLIGNARDHLAATKIVVKLDVGDNQVRGTVEDDGKGFDPEVVLDRSLGDSPLQNLLDLKERVELVSGTLDIYSAEGEGSSIEILLPYTKK
ncbi:MAG: sensor histidine kinase [Anaerolineae bacterium]|jgi:two-component system sensor histidine kinase DegS|nr:MAG: sensor histidine kinase [Anaerolineae bacterium]